MTEDLCLASSLDVEKISTILSKDASQGKRWDSRSGTPSAKHHCNPAKQQEEAKSISIQNNNIS